MHCSGQCKLRLKEKQFDCGSFVEVPTHNLRRNNSIVAHLLKYQHNLRRNNLIVAHLMKYPNTNRSSTLLLSYSKAITEQNNEKASIVVRYSYIGFVIISS